MSILCPTDFSSASGAAADVAAALAQRLNVPLRLLHCASDWIPAGEVIVPLSDEGMIRRQLEKEADRLRGGGELEIRLEPRSGIPYQEIVASAVFERPELLVIGSTGRGRAERWLIGSVAERVAERAPVPTLVVREPDALLSWLRTGSDLRLLCAVDRTVSAGAALTELASLKALGGLQIEAASIGSGRSADYVGDPETRQRDIWERLRETIGEAPVQVHVRDQPGDAVAAFLDIAGERKVNLLVVGSHQRQGWERLKAPSFSRGVLTHAHHNVLCVPVEAVAPSGTEAGTSLPRVERILLATKFAENWTDAVRTALALLPDGGRVHLVHVCPEPKRGLNPLVASAVYFDHCLETVRDREEAERKFRELPESCTNIPGVRLTSEVMVNDEVAGTVCDVAERIGADLICLETGGVSKAGALLGSTVLGVLSKAHKPVLLVPPPLP
jgi:nucleotide-binding universal stress UspA family protein